MKFIASYAYATIEDLDRQSRTSGMMTYSALIAAKGLPLDTLWFINGRLACLTEIDYQEGSETPLTRRLYSDLAVTDAMQPVHEIRHLVIDRQGMRHAWSWKQLT